VVRRRVMDITVGGCGFPAATKPTLPDEGRGQLKDVPSLNAASPRTPHASEAVRARGASMFRYDRKTVLVGPQVLQSPRLIRATSASRTKGVARVTAVSLTRGRQGVFPDRRVSERKVATSTGLMNLGSAALAGVRMAVYHAFKRRWVRV